MSNGKVIPSIKRKLAAKRRKALLDKRGFSEMVSGKRAEIDAQTKAIMNIFNKGMPLRGMMFEERVSSGKLYKMDKKPSAAAKITVGKFRNGI
ncbi:MAG: hypothetical protein U5K79_18505 [Cyclobacteriaceae bacterium]|nr:hypothetical protein [Cyclobacteriaceae bacterium]